MKSFRVKVVTVPSFIPTSAPRRTRVPFLKYRLNPEMSEEDFGAVFGVRTAFSAGCPEKLVTEEDKREKDSPALAISNAGLAVRDPEEVSRVSMTASSETVPSTISS